MVASKGVEVRKDSQNKKELEVPLSLLQISLTRYRRNKWTCLQWTKMKASCCRDQNCTTWWCIDNPGLEVRMDLLPAQQDPTLMAPVLKTWVDILVIKFLGTRTKWSLVLLQYCIRLEWNHNMFWERVWCILRKLTLHSLHSLELGAGQDLPLAVGCAQ